MSIGIIDRIVKFWPARIIIVGIDRLSASLMTVWSSLRLKSLILKSSGPNSCHWSTEIKYPHNIQLGKNVAIGPHCTLGAMSPINIGDFVRISRGAVIETAGLDFSSGRPYKHQSRAIIIENGVWIGSNAIILGGVNIGENAIIGAGAVVSRDVPANMIAVGAPMRLIHPKS